LCAHVASSGTIGVSGYDPILGSLSPPLRVSVHASALLVLWAIGLWICPESLVSGVDLIQLGGCTLSRSLVLSGLVAASAYGLLQYIVHSQLRGVSNPGGPREHRIQRQPRWTDRSTAIDLNPKQSRSGSPSWTYLTGRHSHEWTESRFAGTSAALTGEPVGRDAWAPAPPPSPTRVRVDERLVKELASGGRDDGSVFNPSQNPNRWVERRKCGVFLQSHTELDRISSS
jgi:hypothetical protein